MTPRLAVSLPDSGNETVLVESVALITISSAWLTRRLAAVVHEKLERTLHKIQGDLFHSNQVAHLLQVQLRDVRTCAKPSGCLALLSSTMNSSPCALFCNVSIAPSMNSYICRHRTTDGKKKKKDGDEIVKKNDQQPEREKREKTLLGVQMNAATQAETTVAK